MLCVLMAVSCSLFNAADRFKDENSLRWVGQMTSADKAFISNTMWLHITKALFFIFFIL